MLLNVPLVPQAVSNIRNANARAAEIARQPPIHRFRRGNHSMQAATTIEEPPSEKRFHGMPPIGCSSPTVVEESSKISCTLPLFVTGFGLNEQLTPVGNVAGAQLNKSASPVIPVPAVTEIGMLADPPAGSVFCAGTTSNGGGNKVTCAVTELEGLLCEVAVIVTVGGTGEGFGAVNCPLLLIVPAVVVQFTGWFAVN